MHESDEQYASRLMRTASRPAAGKLPISQGLSRDYFACVYVREDIRGSVSWFIMYIWQGYVGVEVEQPDQYLRL